jgi:thiamine-phosphate pyrophosphorylase
VFVLTDRRRVRAGRDLRDVVAELAEAMAGLTVVVREKDLPLAERLALVGDLAPVVHAAAGRLLLAAGAEVADEEVAAARADGLHLAAHPTPTPTNRELGSFDHRSGGRGRPEMGDEERSGGWVIGRSCHSVAEVRTAAAEGCDHVLLSPVLPTPSKPGYGPALGIDGLRAAVGDLRADGIGTGTRPWVIALGGITPDVADACLAAGADGVAAMGSAMADPETWGAWATDHARRTQEVAS